MDTSTLPDPLPDVGGTPGERKAWKCLALHLRGFTYEEIATVVGYRGRSAARKATQRALELLDDDLSEVKNHGQARAHARYTLLFKPVAELALAGDMKAMSQAIKLADRLANIEGVKPPEQTVRVQVTDALDAEIQELAAALDRATRPDVKLPEWPAHKIVD